MTQQLNFFDHPAPGAEPWPDFAAKPAPRPIDPAWQRMLGIEPRLADLEARAAAGDDLGAILHELQQHVGWYAAKPALRGAANYGRAVKALQAAALWKQTTPLPQAMEGRRK